jgi:hypothetical protein
MMYIMPRKAKSPQRWSVAEARARLPAVFAAAVREPQEVYRRDKAVAVVVSPRAFGELEAGRVERATGTIADAFAELRNLRGRLPVPRRRSRSNSFDEDPT